MRALESVSSRGSLPGDESRLAAGRPRATPLLLALALLCGACAPATGGAPASGAAPAPAPPTAASSAAAAPSPAVTAVPAPIGLTVGVVNPNANVWTTY